LILLSREAAFRAEANELRAQVLRDAAQGCRGLSRYDDKFLGSSYSPEKAYRLECVLRNVMLIQNVDPPLSREIRKLARDFWDETWKSLSQSLVAFFSKSCAPALPLV
jgi:hypothetical protein